MHWVPKEDFIESSYNAQHYARFELIRENADVAVLCDADVALLGRFCDLVDLQIESPSLAGTIAHYSPWQCYPEMNGSANWDELALAVLGRTIDQPYKYSLLDPENQSYTPFYLNYGVVLGTPCIFKKFYAVEKSIRESVLSKVNDWWGPQVCLAFACAEAKLPTSALPLRYNFPNDPIADSLYVKELENIKFLHYLRTEKFDRHKIFVDEGQFLDFLNLSLEGSNAVFQKHVQDLTGGKYPFT